MLQIVDKNTKKTCKQYAVNNKKKQPLTEFECLNSCN